MTSGKKSFVIYLLILTNLMTLGYIFYLSRYKERAIKLDKLFQKQTAGRVISKPKTVRPQPLSLVMKNVPKFILEEERAIKEFLEGKSPELPQEKIMAPDGILKVRETSQADNIIVNINKLGVLKDLEHDMKISHFQEKTLTSVIIDPASLASPAHLYNNGRVKIDGSANSQKTDPLLSSKEKISLGGTISVDF